MLYAENLLDPQGRISPALFPDDGAEALTARLNGYLEVGYENPRVAALEGAEKDEAARAYAYYRAFDAIALRMHREASTLRFADEGERQHLISQMRFFQDERDKLEAEFEELVAVVPAVAVSVVPHSTSTPLHFVW